MSPPDNLRVVIDVSTTGTIRRNSATGEWYVDGDDDKLYLPSTDLPSWLLIEGASVSIQGATVSEPASAGEYTIVDIQVFVLSR